MRSPSATLIAAQTATSRTPYIRMLFNGLTPRDFSTDSGAFGNRILEIDHREEAYNDYAYVTLRDHDSSIPDIRGYWVEIGYGDTTGAGNEYANSQTSRLYVKHQQHKTAQGQLYTVLELEGLWTRMRQTLIRLGAAPLWKSSYDGTVSTIYDILKVIIAEAGCSLPANCPVDDGIIDTFLPVFDINAKPYEFVAGTILRLIQLTKCYLRPPSATGLEFGVVYPQAADAANLTYNSHSSPYFISFMERQPVLVPNHYVVYGNAGSDGLWTGLVTSAAPNGVSQTDIDALYEVYSMAMAPDMTVQADVDNQAAVRLARARAENGSGVAVLQHDCRVELYDKLAFVDNRRSPAATYPSNNMTRVSGLRHLYQPGKYQLEVYLGGTSTTNTGWFDPDTIIQGRALEGKSGIDMTQEEIEGMKALAELNRSRLERSLQDIPNPVERDMEDPRNYPRNTGQPEAQPDWVTEMQRIEDERWRAGK